MDVLSRPVLTAIIVSTMARAYISSGTFGSPTRAVRRGARSSTDHLDVADPESQAWSSVRASIRKMVFS